MESHIPKKKKNERRYRVWIIGLLIVFAVIGLLVFGAFFLVQKTTEVFGDNSRNYSGEEARPFIEDALKITLPDSASNMRFFFISWMDFDMRIKFDLAPDDVPQLLEDLSAMCFEQPLQEGVYPFSSPQEDWWQPDQAKDVIGAEQCGTDAYWALMIDRANPTAWTVYIEAFST